jgi:hypothetical protein
VLSALYELGLGQDVAIGHKGTCILRSPGKCLKLEADAKQVARLTASEPDRL